MAETKEEALKILGDMQFALGSMMQNVENVIKEFTKENVDEDILNRNLIEFEDSLNNLSEYLKDFDELEEEDEEEDVDDEISDDTEEKE